MSGSGYLTGNLTRERCEVFFDNEASQALRDRAPRMTEEWTFDAWTAYVATSTKALEPFLLYAPVTVEFSILGYTVGTYRDAKMTLKGE